MKYLCVFDLDDTLLSPDTSISPENRKALQNLRDLDVGITIATGRSPFMAGKYIDMLSLTLPVICCNGGMLIKPGVSETIWENPIHPQALHTLLKYLLDQRADFLFYTGKTVYYAHESVRINVFREYNKTVPTETRAPLYEFTYADLDTIPVGVNKVLLAWPTPEQCAYVKSIPGLEAVFSGPTAFDIMQEGSSKGNGVLALSKYTGIPVENIAVFGDSENDISMFTCGALGIAMGHGHKKAKAKARYVTGTNMESGVAQGIYKYVLPYFGLGS
ncbi:MAG: HAD family hydrolase [Eubacteriales bacterium]